MFVHMFPTYVHTCVHPLCMHVYLYCHTTDTSLYRMMIHAIKMMVATMINLFVIMQIREMMYVCMYVCMYVT